MCGLHQRLCCLLWESMLQRQVRCRAVPAEVATGDSAISVSPAIQSALAFSGALAVISVSASPLRASMTSSLLALHWISKE